jgi:glycosyltransferase involved in cell wall biosynthesis
MAEIDPEGGFVRYAGMLPYEALHALYAEANLCLFASSCEAFGQIVTEAMSAGLPIACSNRSAMPEILGNAGVYFDPENPDDIANTIIKLIESPELRAQKAQAAFERAKQYSWLRCADETFYFLAKTAVLRQAKEKNR